MVTQPITEFERAELEAILLDENVDSRFDKFCRLMEQKPHVFKYLILRVVSDAQKAGYKEGYRAGLRDGGAQN